MKTKRSQLTARERRKARIRKVIAGSPGRPRLTIFRSDRHMYAQLIRDDQGKVIAAASTLDQEVLDTAKTVALVAEGKSRSAKSVAAAKAVGVVLAKRCQEHSIKHVVFDRNGFAYHGRVRAVAEGAREGGLDF